MDACINRNRTSTICLGNAIVLPSRLSSIHSSTPFPSCMIAHCVCRAFHHAPCIDRAVARRQMNGQRSINSSRRRATTDSARTSHGRLRLHEKPRPAPTQPMISSDRRARWRQSASRHAGRQRTFQAAFRCPPSLLIPHSSPHVHPWRPCPSRAPAMPVCVCERERGTILLFLSRTDDQSEHVRRSFHAIRGRTAGLWSWSSCDGVAWHGMAGRGRCGDRKAASSFVLLSCLGFAFARSLLAAKFVLGWIGYWIYTCSQQRQQRQAADWSMCVSVCQLTVLTSHACVMHPSGWVPPPTTCMPCRCRASQENGCQIIYIFSRR
jgi:hypothetical protein